MKKIKRMCEEKSVLLEKIIEAALKKCKDANGVYCFCSKQNALMVSKAGKYFICDLAGRTTPEYSKFETICFLASALDETYALGVTDDLYKKAMELDTADLEIKEFEHKYIIDSNYWLDTQHPLVKKDDNEVEDIFIITPAETQSNDVAADTIN